MREIGGYFELETNDFVSVYHDNAIAVNSGRNALEYILLANKYTKIYLPYYTCDVSLQPIKKLNIDFEFYYLDKDFFPKLDSIDESAALLFVNYFGLMENKISILKEKYKNLIIDNAQAFYSMPIDSVPTFYSPRKFFGLADGGFAYSNKELELDMKIDKSGDRISHLMVRVEDGAEEGYKLFQENDNKLNDMPLRRMSKLTNKLLRNIDFDSVREIRNENFITLHKALKSENEFTQIIEKSDINGPMVYPFLKKGNDKLRQQLISKKVFVARYWPNVIDWTNTEDGFEKHLYDNLIPLPIDQRWNKEDMHLVCEYLSI